MESEWPYALIALVVVGLLVAAFYLLVERPERRDAGERDRDVTERAARHGWRYEPAAPELLEELAFPPFDRATTDGHRVLRVVSGSRAGVRFRAFDLEHHRFSGGDDPDSYSFQVLAVPLAGKATAISIAPVDLRLDEHDRRMARLPRREPFLVVPLEGRPDLRVVTASRDRAATFVGPVVEVLDDEPGVGWGLDGATALLVRGGRSPLHGPARHWVEDLDHGLALLRRVDEALPSPLLGPPRVLPSPTSRLRFREMTEADLPDIATLDLGGTRGPAGWIEWNRSNYAEHGFGLWVIERNSGEFVGDCGLTMQDVDGELLVEIGWHVRSSLRRQGYAAEAAASVRDAARDAGVTHLVAIIRPDNVASQGVAARIGLELEREVTRGGRPALILGAELASGRP